jgi:hypothetical protein
MRAAAPHRYRILPRTITLVGGGLALALGLSACGGSSAPTTTSTTVSVSSTRCHFVSPAQIQTATGVTVASPGTGVQSIVIGYNSGATTTSFALNRAALRSRGDQLGKILGMGDEAYYAVAHTGGTTVTTVVARKGSEQVLVTGTATLTELETLAEQALAKAAS